MSKSGKEKLKKLFQDSPNKKFTPSFLEETSGIRDWTRTIREIRGKDGINIVWHEKTPEYPDGCYVNEA